MSKHSHDRATNQKLSPFVIDIPQETLDDLHHRLMATRWLDEVPEAGWTMGTSVEYLKDLVDYWHNKYDWREQERELNELAQFTADVDGVNIHFAYERGKGPNPLPLVLTHGWPDTFQRFHKIIPMLTDPERYGGNAEDSFDVIVPDVPGFGFSERKTMTSTAVADLWASLMTNTLGYEQFGAVGGDVGTLVTKALALQHPEILIGIHLTDCGYPTGNEDFSTMTEAEIQFASFVQGWWMREGAYAMTQSTKPQTVAVGLNDSPAGLAAWILSFLDTGADNNDVENAFGGRDSLLTNLMIYWTTQTAGSAARMYLEDARAAYAPDAPKVPLRSETPAGIALFPRSADFPREWAERSVNVQQFTKMPKGGHFAALEEPELYTQDLRTFFAKLR